MQKGAFAAFLTQHIQELDDDEGNIKSNGCYKLTANYIAKNLFTF